MSTPELMDHRQGRHRQRGAGTAGNSGGVQLEWNRYRLHLVHPVLAALLPLVARESEEHQIMAKLEREASYCSLCKKQFTSPNQLEEHKKGKWHQMRQGQRRRSAD